MYSTLLTAISINKIKRNLLNISTIMLLINKKFHTNLACCEDGFNRSNSPFNILLLPPGTGIASPKSIKQYLR